MSDDDSTDDDLRNAPKFHTDRSHYGPAFERWFASRHPERSDVVVADIDIPTSTGFSNETVFVDLTWTEDGEARAEKYVARIEPDSGALFPAQTDRCRVSVEVQHRAMETVARHCDAPVPDLLGYEADASIIGQPFFVMGYTEGRVPADTPRYSEEGFLVDEATPAQRTDSDDRPAACEAMAQIHSPSTGAAADLGWLDASGTREPAHPGHPARSCTGRSTLDAELDGGATTRCIVHGASTGCTENDPHDERIGLSRGVTRGWATSSGRTIEPAAVVDWEACALSPTEADVGWWLMFDRMSFEDLEAPSAWRASPPATR